MSAVVAAMLVAAFVGVGVVGAAAYLRNFWLYRGYPPPRDPPAVASGTTVHISVRSAELQRMQPVDVYLPPGYAQHRARRYPVFYLLHGFPGRPGAFLLTVRAGVVDDILAAHHSSPPLILVMPFGSTGTFTDKEWANGVRPRERWEAFVARDLVHAIDSRYRTIRSGAGRALGGLSEGGYGALNIGLHHPGEFRVLESWSGYERADDIRSIFDRRRSLLRWNSPLDQLPRVAPVLRRAHTFIWFYTGQQERGRLLQQNVEFDRQLTRFHVAHRFLLRRGGHNWALWRGNAGLALLAAGRHLRA